MVQSRGCHLSPPTRLAELQYSMSSRAGTGKLGPAPLSLCSFLLSYSFQVPFCYLGWKFHTCSAQRNAARATKDFPGNDELLFICDFPSQKSEGLSYFLGYSINDLFQLGSNYFQITASGEKLLLISTGSLFPDL